MIFQLKKVVYDMFIFKNYNRIDLNISKYLVPIVWYLKIKYNDVKHISQLTFTVFSLYYYINYKESINIVFNLI